MRFHSVLLLPLFLVACGTSSVLPTDDAVMPGTENAISRHGDIPVDLSRSSVRVSGTVAGRPVDAAFQSFTAQVNLDDSRIEGVVDTRSIHADSPGLDQALQDTTFLSAQQFPTATLSITDIQAGGRNRYLLAGTLTIKGITKPVRVPAMITDSGLTFHVDLLRSDFGLGDDALPGPSLSAAVGVDVQVAFGA